MKRNVALIFGGEGKEREISELSAKNLATLIDTEQYNLILVRITERGEWYIYDGNTSLIKGGVWQTDKTKLKNTYPVKLGDTSGLLGNGEIIRVDCAIPCLHGNFGEDGIIQGALTAAHINYVGQSVYSSAITSDKSYTKLVAKHLGIPTAKWIICTSSSIDFAMAQAELHVGYPMFLKPTRLGSSYGAHPVCSKEEFERAYKDAYAYEKRVLVEELISTKYELECAYLESDGILLAPYGKITTNGNFYGYEEKYKSEKSPKTDVLRDGIEARVKKAVLEYSEALVRFLELRHLSRIDFFVTEDGAVYFNEINTFPGMTETSLYPALTEVFGLSRGDFINLLIESVCNDGRDI